MTKPTTYRLFVPRWRPPLNNEWRGRHWGVAYRLRRKTARLLGTYRFVHGIPRAICRRSVAVEVILAPRMRQPDADSMDKLLLDALVAADMLLDDSAHGLAGRVEVTFRRGDAKTWGTQITFTDRETRR